MSKGMFIFERYCWNIGNTTFRVKELAYKNEVQLGCLEKLFAENPNIEWGPVLEALYYDLLTSVSLVKGTAPNKEKDARELSSPLCDLGLITKKRKTTPVGQKLLSISKKGDYNSDNLLYISKDSYIYLLQFLKMQIDDVKPFVVLLYFLLKLGHLSKEEFSYCLPVCCSMNDVERIKNKIQDIRDKKITVEDFLIKEMLNKNNYKNALEYFVDKDFIDKETIEDIGMNRKSSTYDAPIIDVYSNLHELWDNKSATEKDIIKTLIVLKSKILKINVNQRSAWSQYLGIKNSTKFDSEFIENFYKIDLLTAGDEKEFRKKFFIKWHYFKWKSNLDDYYDLNKRYFSLADIIEFNNNTFKLTEIAKHYFKDIIDDMIKEELKSKEEYFDYFSSEHEINEIYSKCNKTKADLAKSISEEVGEEIQPGSLNEYIKDKEESKFIEMIDAKFDKNKTLVLLDAFKNRRDDVIHEEITDDASPSSCFEYILAIIWYRISGRKGRLRDCMNGHLDANMLPKTHASGLMSDLIFKYDRTNDYAEHDLLIEATLSESSGQRKMEWEPVSRHLEANIKTTNNENDYVLFIAGKLADETVKTFRLQKNYDFDCDGHHFDYLKIIPIDIDILKAIMEKEYNYSSLYKIFEKSFRSDLISMNWYNSTIREEFIK